MIMTSVVRGNANVKENDWFSLKSLKGQAVGAISR
jgi:hypothetical protein